MVDGFSGPSGSAASDSAGHFHHEYGYSTHAQGHLCINEDIATCATIGDVIKLQSGGAFVMVYQPTCNDATVAEAVSTSVAVLVDGKMAAVSQYQGEQCVANILVQRAGRPLPLIFAYSADPQRRTGMVRNNGATAELDPTRPVAGFDQILRWLASVP